MGTNWDKNRMRFFHRPEQDVSKQLYDAFRACCSTARIRLRGVVPHISGRRYRILLSNKMV